MIETIAFKSILDSDIIQRTDEILIYNSTIWTILSFFLGLGDRHNDNVGTVKENGMELLCHIDFGYMLGTDPNLKKPILTNFLNFFIQSPQDNFLRISDKIQNEEAVNNNRELIVAEIKRTYDLFYINLCFYKPPPEQQVDVKRWTNKFFVLSDGQESESDLFKEYFDLSKGILQKTFIFHDTRPRFHVFCGDVTTAFRKFFG